MGIKTWDISNFFEDWKIHVNTVTIVNDSIFGSNVLDFGSAYVQMSSLIGTWTITFRMKEAGSTLSFGMVNGLEMTSYQAVVVNEGSNLMVYGVNNASMIYVSNPITISQDTNIHTLTITITNGDSHTFDFDGITGTFTDSTISTFVNGYFVADFLGVDKCYINSIEYNGDGVAIGNVVPKVVLKPKIFKEIKKNIITKTIKSVITC